MTDHVSLMHGWMPAIVQAAAVTVLLLAIGWRSRRWRTLLLPLAILVGVATATCVPWYINTQGLAGESAPRWLSIWMGLIGLALPWLGGQLGTPEVPRIQLPTATASSIG